MTVLGAVGKGLLLVERDKSLDYGEVSQMMRGQEPYQTISGLPRDLDRFATLRSRFIRSLEFNSFPILDLATDRNARTLFSFFGLHLGVLSRHESMQSTSMSFRKVHSSRNTVQLQGQVLRISVLSEELMSFLSTRETGG